MTNEHTTEPIATSGPHHKTGDGNSIAGLDAATVKWALWIIIALTALIYSQTVFYGFLNMDDDTFILNNPLIKAPGLDGILQLFTTFNNSKYQPLVLLSYMLEYRIFGFSAFHFHAFNLVLHLLDTWLVFKFTEQLSGKAVTALVVAALFALHPMHVEEVAWISEMKDTLPAFFYLWAMIYYLKYTGSGFKPGYYVGLLLFSLAALLSKSAAVTLPAVFILIDYYKGRPVRGRAITEKIPLVLLSLLFLVIGAVSKTTIQEFGIVPATHLFVNRVFLFTYVPSFYVVQLIAPLHLTAMHYYPQADHDVLPWIYYASFPFCILMVWLVARRSSFKKELVFGTLFFIITISVMEQVVSIGPTLTPERYSYIPYIGFFYIIGQWCDLLWAGKWRNIAVGAFVAFLLLFCAITWVHISVWKNDDAIFGDVIDKNVGSPDNYYPYFVLGKIKHVSGDLNNALQDYNESIALNPYFSGAYDNRGGLYLQVNNMQSALVDFNNAIRYDPNRASAYNNRATLEAMTGDFKNAIIDYSTFLQMQPDNKRAYADRGMARLSGGDSTGACTDFRHSAQMGNTNAVQLLQQYCR